MLGVWLQISSQGHRLTPIDKRILVTCCHPSFFSQMGSEIHLFSHSRRRIFVHEYGWCVNCFFLGEKVIAFCIPFERKMGVAASY